MSTINDLLPTAIFTIALHRYHQDKKKAPGSRKHCVTIKRKQRSVHEVFDELGRINFWRAYRLEIQNFFKLYLLIKKDLINTMQFKKGRNFVPNGRVHPTVALACSLRIFAGGSTYDEEQGGMSLETN